MGTEKKEYRLAALAGTIIFHGLLLLLFFLVVFKTPIPPYPDSGGPGLEVNFGLSEDGMGDVQPDEYTDQIASAESVENENNNTGREAPSAQNLLTQETEEAPAVAKTEKPAETREKETAEKKPEPRKPNKAALYPGKSNKNTQSNQGEGETGKPGDQGEKDGNKQALYHGPGGGNGNAPGDGGDGPGGKNKGPSYSLAGRKPKSLPVPKSTFQEEGKVVVEITVDKNGVVIAAKPGVKGSTTSNLGLLAIARKAALAARFNVSEEAPEEQKGTITYNFTFSEHHN